MDFGSVDVGLLLNVADALTERTDGPALVIIGVDLSRSKLVD